MIPVPAFVVPSVHRACSVRMLRRLMAAIVVYGAVLTIASPDVIYVGFHTISNDKTFDKSMAYKKIQALTILLQHLYAVQWQFVKKLVFSNVEVYFHYKRK